MNQTSPHTSSWRNRIHALGPGILMASAAIGGSHLIASTQAGALYGWQLAVIILLTNLFKYPFFRFSAHYTLDNGKSLIEGYAEKSRVYLWIFLILCFFAATINAGAVAVVTAVIVKVALPDLPMSNNAVAVCVMALTLLLLLAGHYKALDRVSKLIVVSLSVATVVAAGIAMSRGMQMQPDFVEPSPWNMASLGFIIALMGWMPAPIEISAINSQWVTARQKIDPVSYRDGMFDFNTGFMTSALLAVVFLILGAYVQYGNGEEVQMAGGKYVGQLINMYAVTIGEWARPLVAFIAFACMFGTTITVVDGYARALTETSRLIRGRSAEQAEKGLTAWILWVAGSGLALILWFNSAMGALLKFAMITAFLAAPVFAWLNYWLVKDDKKHKVTPAMKVLTYVGLVYLAGFSVLFLLNLLGLIA
ncbi:Nramp family divalent metal transporter [Neisseria animalis]|uniref:Divalent metal cation transporter n=1 Tax=Neisseria animalis TaxID=492 RepID=A0A5P3MQN1_NEIAN|nr:Nramp family divalent metal transporter [Neisseria animalis]QEY23375.1 divalent metal cation transporter [Neisseria animalis]ROW33220.1 divalent metal cation transporter [Neisseria animalis]VEE08791.1 membrane protein [Neisseria animalis]